MVERAVEVELSLSKFEFENKVKLFDKVEILQSATVQVCPPQGTDNMLLPRLLPH